jgi:predicted GH43/DUF377 family glycosyl hydrolase
MSLVLGSPVQRHLTIYLAVFALACESPPEAAYVGECAVYPSSAFDYGQIGIGNCLAGPTAMAWVPRPDDPSKSMLVVANANPFLDFDGGSLLNIDASGLPTDGSTALMHELAAQGLAGAVNLPSYAGGLDVVEERALAAVTVRLSVGAEDMKQDDNLWLVDLSQPLSPSLAKLSEEGTAQVLVEADPIAVSYDSESGRAFVSNVSSGSISVVDMLSNPVAVVDAVPRAKFKNKEFIDADGSLSQVSIADLDVTTVGLFPHDEWTLTFVEGRFQLSVPTEEGIYHMHASGQDDWVDSALGIELSHEDTDGEWGVLADPQIWQGFGGTRMALADTASGQLVAVTSAGNGGVWGYDSTPLLSPRRGGWDAVLSGPMAFFYDGLEYLFYDGTDADGRSAIGLASSEDGLSYLRENGGDPVFVGGGEHDSEGVADPHVLYDAQADLWRMYYSAFDGEQWSLGHATSADLLEWEADSEPLLLNNASPVVIYTNGQFRLWSVGWSGSAWELHTGLSIDGRDFTGYPILGVLDGTHSDFSSPPGLGLKASLSESWSIEGALRGLAGVSFQAGTSHSESSVGWRIFLTVGAFLTEELLNDDGKNGLSASSWIVDQDWVYGTVTDADGVKRVGLLKDALSGEPIASTLLEGKAGAFDADGVSDPVVFWSGTEWLMLYAGQGEGLTGIGLASSDDGLLWQTDHTPVLLTGEDWDALSIRPGSVSQGDEGFSLWYTGSDGDGSLVGRANSLDGRNWTKVLGAGEDWFFEEGAPGAFDDSAVADPYVIDDGDLLHLWYSAFDGDVWSIGYASSTNQGASWTRTLGAVSEETRPVIRGQAASFDQLSARRPVVNEIDGRLFMLYTGQDSAVDRVGLALGTGSAIWHRSPARATTGDLIRFETVPGDKGGRESISLSQTVDGFMTSGLGVTASHVDNERGFLYVSSAASAYIYVIDIRDDSTSDWTDNLYEIEALLVASSVTGAIGFRAMVAPAGSPYLYAVNDDPESVMVFDLDRVLDDHLGEVHLEAVVGALPAPRGAVKDAGADTLASVGPSNLVLNGDRLFVANFNANSVSVYDLSLGVHGTWTHEIPGVGENPHAMALSPDGSLLAVASIVGALDGQRVQSQIAIIDTETLEIVGWIANE